MDSLVQTGFVKQSSPIELGSINKGAAPLPELVSSLAIPGFPPSPGPSTFADETAERLQEFMKRWQMTSLAASAQVGVSSASMLYPGAVSCDRLTAISIHFTLFVLLDDALFDPHNSTLREFLQLPSAVDSTIPELRQIREFAQNLDVLFRHEAQPRDPIRPIEGMMWELGREFRRLSNPAWFTRFANAFKDYYDASIHCHAADMTGDQSHTRDLESYTRMRVREFGGHFVILHTEFASNEFLPEEVCVHPGFTQVTNAAAIQMVYVNDVFSYAKEVMEANSRNLIKVLMATEGLLLPEAAWKAVGLVNCYSRRILELEKELPINSPAVGCFLKHLKYMLSGHIRWSSLNKLYRCEDSPFPELRPSFYQH